MTTYKANGTQTTPTINVGTNLVTGITVDVNGKIYVTTSTRNKLTTYKADGTQTTPTITAGLNQPNGVAVDFKWQDLRREQRQRYSDDLHRQWNPDDANDLHRAKPTLRRSGRHERQDLE